MAGEAIKAAQIELYEGGEYWALGAVLEPAADALVRAAGIGDGDHVLDVAAGDGGVALAAARHGASVVATDLSRVQVQRGRERFAREGFDGQSAVADAESLPFKDFSFDRVVSGFGVVAAPDPPRATRELFRVCRAGGVVALTAWSRESYMSELVRALREAIADQVVFPDPDMGWGDEALVRERLGQHSEEVSVRRESLQWDPRRRAAAGRSDCAAAYFAARLSATKLMELGEVRDGVDQRFKTAEGLIRAEYLLVTARTTGT